MNRISLPEQYKNQVQWRDWPSYLGPLPASRNDVILDIGCSTGEMTALLAGNAFEVTGIDNNPELLAYAATNNSSYSISYKQMDARALVFADCMLYDGIWSSFVPAYFTDFSEVLKRWIHFLKPGGWIALVEMSDLFNHDPLSVYAHEAFEKYYSVQLQSNLYDFRMGSRLHSYVINSGLHIIHEESKYDAELTFSGPAGPGVFTAWERRFERMSMLKDFLGVSEFGKIRNEFLSCIMSSEHVSHATVKYIVATRPNGG